MKKQTFTAFIGIILWLLAQGCAGTGDDAGTGNDIGINGDPRDTDPPIRDPDTNEHSILLRGVHGTEADPNSIAWLAVVDRDGTHEIEWAPSSDGEMRVTIRGGRFGVAYRCDEEDNELRVAYTTVAELSTLDLLCPEDSAGAACAGMVSLNWDGFEGNGALLSGADMTFLEPPLSVAPFYYSLSNPRMFVADTQGGIAERLFSSALDSNGCNAETPFLVDLTADAAFYIKHELIQGTLSHPTALIDDEDRTVYCASRTLNQEEAYTCLVSPSSTRYSLAAEGRESRVGINGRWTGGGRWAEARFGSEIPAEIELPLFEKTDFSVLRDTGRLPDLRVKVTPNADAPVYVLNIECDDFAYVGISATRGWVEAGEPLVPPVLDGTSVDPSIFNTIRDCTLTTRWSSRGLEPLFNRAFDDNLILNPGDTYSEIYTTVTLTEDNGISVGTN